MATTWMNPENIMLSEISQTPKNKYRIGSRLQRVPGTVGFTETARMVAARGLEEGKCDAFLMAIAFSLGRGKCFRTGVVTL